MEAIRINYIYLDEVYWEKFGLAVSEIGWDRLSLVRHMLHGYFSRQKEFYRQAALMDADARGMVEQEYYEALLETTSSDFTQLRDYLVTAPGFGVTPLDDTPLPPTTEECKRVYHQVSLSPYNYVLLRVATIVHLKGGKGLSVLIG